ncbi:hypothetical protein [Streptacidiphilus rugosus]|uniref:hypothetical protein n=1 Tax=Streptacidiphilus rugosus TaxID=405783 RepID=UPI00056B1EA9|nr:hypothetical protein [Streptacidiphilus rugosus]
MPDEKRAWTEKWMWWCVKEFGRDTAKRRVALPEPSFYPVDYDGSEAKIRQLVVRVCLVMCVEPDSVQVGFFRTPEGTAATKRHAVGTYQKAGGVNRIRLDLREAGDPARLAGVIAHELAHKRLMGEPRHGL